MHFFYKVPQKELEVLREQKEKFKSYDEGPRLVLKKMTEADALLKQIGDPAAKDIVKNEADLQSICNEIKTAGDAKKNPVDSIFISIRDNYLYMMEAKRKERSGSGANDAMGEMTKQLNETKEKLRTCETERDMFKTMAQVKQ
jgi:hypothetical protein